MREIKLKAWDAVNKKMIRPMSFESGVGCSVPNQYLNHTDSEIFLSCRFNGVEFLQFTGFQDSKGNDIYEGDIVYVAGFSRKAKAIITHEHGSEFEDLDGCHRSMINAAAENDIGEIVGNIHQNPELLEQNK